VNNVACELEKARFTHFVSEKNQEPELGAQVLVVCKRAVCENKKLANVQIERDVIESAIKVLYLPL
jgi:hypothetical protein